MWRKCVKDTIRCQDQMIISDLLGNICFVEDERINGTDVRDNVDMMEVGIDQVTTGYIDLAKKKLFLLPACFITQIGVRN